MEEVAEADAEFNFMLALTFGLTFSLGELTKRFFSECCAAFAVVECPAALTALWRADEVFGEPSLVIVL